MSSTVLTLFCGLLLCLTAVSNDIVLPAFFDISRDLTAPIELVQAVVPVFMVMAGISQLVFGTTSDRFGRRPMLLVGLACFLAGAATAALAPNIWIVLLGRVLQGIGAGGVQSVARAILRDVHHGAAFAKAMAMAMAMFAIAPLLAPLFGVGLIALGGWQAVFIGLFGLGLTLGAIAIVAFRETHLEPNPDALALATIRDGFAQLLTHPQSRFYLIVASLTYYNLASFVTNAPRIYRSAFGIEGAAFAAIVAVTGLGIVLGQYINHRVIGRLGVVTSTRAALAIILIVSLLALGLEVGGVLSLPVITLLMLVFNSSFLVVIANTASLVIEPHRPIAGLASSMFGTATQLTGAILTVATLPIIGGNLAVWALITSVIVGGLLGASLLSRGR